MVNYKEILDLFGKSIIKDVFDRNIEYISQELELFKQSEYQDLFLKMDARGKLDLEKLVFNISKDTLFDFLNIFEENEKFKLIYEENGKQVNLVEISEMLKSEPIIENGWIERFSQYSKDN